MIIFENIDTGETMGVDRQTGGANYEAKLSALINSSNMGINADRGQDKGWRLSAEQQALIEQWEQEPGMIEKVSEHTKTIQDDLTHANFLSYLLYQQELGKSPEQAAVAERREKELDYEKRVAKLKVKTKES
jgi:hypothetical protein